MRTVQGWLKSLEQCGYINISYDRGSYESCTRKIYINANYVNPSPDTTGIDGETEADPETARAEYVESPSVNKEYVRQIFAKWNNYGLPNRGEIEFLNRFGRCHQYLKGISSSDVLSAIDNYASIRQRSDSWYAKKHNLTFESFCKVIDKFLDGNFFAENFCDAPKESKESEQMTNPNISYKECPKCHHKTAVKMSDIRPIYYHCDNCKQDSTEEQIEDTEKFANVWHDRRSRNQGKGEERVGDMGARGSRAKAEGRRGKLKVAQAVCRDNGGPERRCGNGDGDRDEGRQTERVLRGLPKAAGRGSPEEVGGRRTDEGGGRIMESERAYWAMISANLVALYRQKTAEGMDSFELLDGWERQGTPAEVMQVVRAEAGTRSIERKETSGEVFAGLFGGFLKTQKKLLTK